MKATRILLMLLITGTLLFGGENPAALMVDQSEIGFLETWLNETVDYYHIPGLVIGVVYNQDLLWTEAFGYANLETKEQMTIGHRFRIASISKTFTSMAIMQLRDAGKLNLNDPLKLHLDWFEIKSVFMNAPPVTIQQVLTHTSGLPREAAFPYWTDHNFPTREQIIKALPGQEMIYEPETKWKYSNLGMALLGEIIAEVSGISYDAYIEKHILEPLGMSSTSTQLDADDQKMVATGYLKYMSGANRLQAPFTDAKGITAAGNLTSNVEDLAKFISTQFEDATKVTILKQSTLNEMHRVHWLRPGWQSGWGLGFSVSKNGDSNLVGHGGWVAGYRSQILFSPEDRIGVICLINTEDFSPFIIAKQVMNRLTPVIRRALPAETSRFEFNPEWEMYTGKYEDPTYWQTDVLILNKKLYLYGYSLPPEDDPSGGLTELVYEGKPHTFRMSGENGNGETVVFEMDNGKVKQVKTGENYIYPLGEVPAEMRKVD